MSGIEALEACFLICKFFYDQKELNDEAKSLVADLAEYVRRLLPALESLNTRGLESAALQLSHLWACLKECKRIYVKYQNGWKASKFWVTPEQIRDKAKTQEERTRHAWQDLSTALSIAIHNNMQPSAPAGAEIRTDDTWELNANFVHIDMQKNGVPRTVLGQGSSGVVGLGTFKAGFKGVPVAVKMKMSNVLAAAQRDPQIVENFKREVRLLAAIDHPHIVQCYGGITRMDGGYAMWIVMEMLDFTLFEAIKGKKIKIGRDDPQTYVDFVAGICSALDYLHSPVDGNPTVHRDLKPQNIMIKSDERVVKLIDFDMAKETQAGVGSTTSTKGTREYMAPEILENGAGGCSVATDMWACGLVARFIWCGLTPDENPDRGTIEASPHPKAIFTQELMSQCLNERPEYRPAAVFVSFRLFSFVVPSPEVKGICFHCGNPVYSVQVRGRDQIRGYYHTACVNAPPVGGNVRVYQQPQYQPQYHPQYQPQYQQQGAGSSSAALSSSSQPPPLRKRLKEAEERQKRQEQERLEAEGARACDGIQFALPWPQVAAVPSIYIKVIKAEGIRQHKGRVPTPSMLIRVSVAGQAQPEVLKTKPMPAGSDPLWCDFALPFLAFVTDNGFKSVCQMTWVYSITQPHPDVHRIHPSSSSHTSGERSSASLR